jgi:hypothetical protein
MEHTRKGPIRRLRRSRSPATTVAPRVCCFTRVGEQERPEQLIRDPGTDRLALRPQEAVSTDGLLGRLWQRRPSPVTFERDLRNYDAQAFNTAGVPLYTKHWRSAMTNPPIEGWTLGLAPPSPNVVNQKAMGSASPQRSRRRRAALRARVLLGIFRPVP